MKRIGAALVCFFASTAAAQFGGYTGGYMGPGVLSTGAGNIGTRSGQQVDLRFYADVQGVYDNGMQPFALNSQNQLYTVNGLYGEQIDLGAYGQHQWKNALLGLDYHGSFYHYDNDSAYDGTNQTLALGYTYQKSRRLIFNIRELGGTARYGYGSSLSSYPGALVGQPSAILFNNSFYYLQTGADVTYLLSPRTSFTAGGDGFFTRYQASGLIGMNGYNLRGSIQHRLSRTRTIGANYQHMHFDFVHSYGQSDINLIELFYATQLGKHLTVTISAGGFQSEVQGVQQITLSPVVAALLGQSFGFETFYAANYNPSGSVHIVDRFKRSSLSADYVRTVVPGNGLYLTSRQDSGGLGYSYTGIRNWNLGVSGGFYQLGSFGQQLQAYRTYMGGAGFTYNLTRAFHIIGRYDYRHQDIHYVGFRLDSSRVTLGLAFSPGDIPLSLW